MKRILLPALLLAACGGSDSTGKDLSKFTGAAWNIQLTTTITCPLVSPFTQSGSTTTAFTPGSNADLQVTLMPGCVLQLDVSGNTATVANAPVTCSISAGGLSGTATLASGKATTSDGHNLSFDAAGTASNGSISCPLSVTGTGTR
jgi:hypothetical protein